MIRRDPSLIKLTEEDLKDWALQEGFGPFPVSFSVRTPHSSNPLFQQNPNWSSG